MAAPSVVEPRVQMDLLADAITTMLHAIGENPSRAGLRRTPERAAKAFAELTSGSSQTLADVLNGALFTEDYNEMVLVKDIEFYSLCAQYLLPFHGRAHIAYLPEGRVIGLSKLPRVLEIYARRLQVQEQLTQQVAWAIEEAIKPRGVAVMLEAAHFCMKMRGVEKQNSKTVTLALLGAFRDSLVRRKEFLAAVGGPHTL